MSITKCLVLALSVVASVNALATPHAARNSIHHRSVAARVAEPRSVNAGLAVAPRAPTTVRKRCRARPSSSSSASSSTVSATSTPPINAAPIPTSTSTSTKTSSTVQDEATTTTTKSTPAPTTSKPAATTSASSGGGSAPGGFLAGTQNGQGTFYDTGLGACGDVSTDSDPIIAVSHLLFDTYPGYNGVNPNNNPICGKKIKASRGDKSVVVTVVDRCGACKMTDLDFSPTAFDALTNANRGLGRVEITWEWA
ncbi:hypothetical protein D9611_006867 [Ephemerocybe angulata]|uniref:RlpA-like protein double-psi beta-barrel domain-containing protein n=1 Tax=Ephemerocybe angulata TaxID=980116 RepID=A0A8H5AZK0_9AGAR|nr:hypothetical protein D9611_006867 [Tulosesus angulatus]